MQFKGKIAAVALACLSAPTFASTTFQFSDLNQTGHGQDSPVAADTYAAQGLVLSSNVLTACGGQCISTGVDTFSGAITGTFTGGSNYEYLEFVGVTGSQTISLYDASNALVTTLGSPSGTASEPTFESGGNWPDYVYNGTVGIASWTANFNYDGLIALTADRAVSAVSESGNAAMMLAGLALLGGRLRRRIKSQ